MNPKHLIAFMAGMLIIAVAFYIPGNQPLPAFCGGLLLGWGASNLASDWIN